MDTKYIPNPIYTKDVELPEELSALVEEIAKNVHEVWSQSRINDGWTYGEKRDDVDKKHPCLVAYEDLPESEKEYDRATSQETLKLILKLGFEIKKSITNNHNTMSNLISNSAADLLRAMNQQDDRKREDLAKSINNHSLNAAGLGFIPVPFADMAAIAVNVWHMYVKINDILGIPFKENSMKSIASAAIANISGSILAAGLANILKAVPGANIPALVIAAAANYAICYSSAWVYLQVLTTVTKQQNGKVDLDTISVKTLKRYIKENKDKQKEIAKEAKTEYAKNHKDDK